MKSYYFIYVVLIFWIAFVAPSCSASKRANENSSNNNLSPARVESHPSARQDVTDVDLDLLPPISQSLSNKDWMTTDVQIIRRDDGEMTIEGIFQDRDMTAYRQGGYFDCRSSRSSDCGRQKIRDFVWDCWTKRQRGYIRNGWSGIDVRGTTHIFIEPHEIEGWTVMLREIKIQSSLGPAYLMAETTGRMTIDRRHRRTKNERFSLVLKNGDDETIRTF